MKNRYFIFVMGMLTGAVLFGGSVAYAAGVTARHNPQTVYIDNSPAQMEAYTIGGYNYVKLRDIGQMMGFNVYWDGKSVQIDSDAPYTGEAPAQADTSIQVSSMNGNTLKAGERSSLITSPYGIECTAVSSNANVASLEKVLGYWVAVAKAPGTAVVTVTTSDGRSGSLTITVEPADPVTPTVEYPVDLNANMEIRQEMIRLINKARRESGAPELPISSALMDAAQTCANNFYSYHHNREECEAVAASGYPNGFGSNITAFTGAARDDIAQRAIANWLNSPGHRDTMLDPDCDSLGVGVAESGKGVTYCYLFIGKPGTHNPYE